MRAAGASSRRLAARGEEALPQSIGRYQILGELGRGGAGAVYRAHDPHLRRDVALKLLLAGKDASSRQRRRFAREARTLARLRHPNIVALHDVGEFRSQPYIVLDLAEGETLQELIERAGPLEPERAARIARDLALALSCAHSQGIIHRDVKPENVFLTQEGEVLLGDFGLVRDLDPSATATLTQGRLVGTPGYLAPEQAQGLTDQIGPTSDVFGLGATLYAMLLRRKAFAGDNLQQVIVATLECRPDPPGQVRPQVGRILDAICMACLRRDPSERFHTALELAEALDTYLEGGEPEMAPRGATSATHPVPTETEVQAGSGRRSWLVVLLAATTLIWLGISILLMWKLSQVQADRDALVEELEATRRE